MTLIILHAFSPEWCEIECAMRRDISSETICHLSYDAGLINFFLLSKAGVSESENECDEGEKTHIDDIVHPFCVYIYSSRIEMGNRECMSRYECFLTCQSSERVRVMEK